MPRTRRTPAEQPPPVQNPPLESDFGWALRMLSTAFSRNAISAVADLPGGPRGYLVLVALSAGDPPSQLALAQQVSLDRTVMTYLLDDLEGRGLVLRRPDPKDRRARQVLITEDGRDALASARSRLDDAERLVLSDLDEQESATLRGLMTRVALTAQREDPRTSDC